jgi:hypothetical protein
MSDNQRENLTYMAMGVAMGVGIGYMIAMYIVYI